MKLTRDPHRLKTLLLSSEIDEKLPSTIKSMRTVDKLWITIFQYCFAKCCSLLKQDDRNLQFIFRCCGKATVVKQLLCHGFVTVTGFTFHLSLKKTVNAYDMPNDLIINIDKAPLLFVLMCKCAMYKTNKKFVPIRNNSDNYQITGTFLTALGYFKLFIWIKRLIVLQSLVFDLSLMKETPKNYWYYKDKLLKVVNYILYPM